MTQAYADRARELSRPYIGSQRPTSLLNRLYGWLRGGVNRTLYRFIAPRALEGRREARVLEAGAGSAEASSLFADDDRVGLNVALDLDEPTLRRARERDPRLRAVVADLKHLPFADGAFDLVFNSSTVEHLERPESAVTQMARVCREDGHVFVGVPKRHGPLGFQPLVRRTTVGIWIGEVFSHKELRDLCARSGLEVVGRLTYFFRFFAGAIGKPKIYLDEPEC